jgi:hypothetical protein
MKGLELTRAIVCPLEIPALRGALAGKKAPLCYDTLILSSKERQGLLREDSRKIVETVKNSPWAIYGVYHLLLNVI